MGTGVVVGAGVAVGSGVGTDVLVGAEVGVAVSVGFGSSEHAVNSMAKSVTPTTSADINFGISSPLGTATETAERTTRKFLMP